MQALAEAISNDSMATVRRLLDKNEANIRDHLVIGDEYELDDPDEVSVLVYAIRTYADIEMIKLLMEYGADIHEIDTFGVGSVDVAIKFKRYDVVKLCIDSGIDLNVTKRKSGITPLMLASCFNDTDMIDLLLENGASVSSVDKMGMSAIDYSKKMGQKKMSEYLKEKGVEHNLYK